MGNANQDNLWEQLTFQGHYDRTLDQDLTIKQIMDSWTLKKGYPVVSIQRLVNYNNNSLTLKLAQKWFLLNPLNKLQNTLAYSESRWYVPFTFTSMSNPRFEFESKTYWMKPESHHDEISVPIENVNRADLDSVWIIGNVEFSGFYRVNYDLTSWKLLINQLQTDPERIGIVNRAQLIDDSFNLAKAEYIDNSIYLELLSYLVNETESLPFKAARDGLHFMEEMFSFDYVAYNSFKVSMLVFILNNCLLISGLVYFKEFSKKLYAKVYERLGWNNITDFQEM
jgi:aminopeptidase N